MIVTISSPVEKRCPYRDEIDTGTVTLTFDVPKGDGPELHEVADYLRGFIGAAISHEEFTREVQLQLSALHVRTTWQTAGLEVTVEVPDRRE